jgi:methenyltetrahydromethanopterin cyclohydrolase
MTEPLHLNERACWLVDDLADRAAELRVESSTLANGTRILDCGVKALGGLEAGLGMARVCLAGLGGVSLVPGEISGVACPLVQVQTDWPVAACMASQYAGWQIAVGKFFAMGSGPMRAAAGREELFEKIGHRESPERAVGVLETRKLPTEEVAAYIGERAKVAPERLTLLVAPTASQAGTIQIVARSVETAMHKLFELGFDLSQVVSGYGTAPLPPVAADDLQGIGRTNDAILYGGRVTLWVKSDDALLADIGPKVPSNASPDHGAPFASIFERYHRDFYKIDKMLFSPAEIVFCNLNTGRTQHFGRTEPDVPKRSFHES